MISLLSRTTRIFMKPLVSPFSYARLDPLTLHLLFQNPESLIDIVIANDFARALHSYCFPRLPLAWAKRSAMFRVLQ